HRDTDHPDDLHRAEEAVIEIQKRTAANESKFQNNQPESTSNEKLGEFAFAFSARKLEVCPRAGKKHEDRRTEVRNPTRKEKHRIGVCQVCGVESLKHIAMNKVARMIEQHDHHHDAAQKIDGIDAG